MPHALRACSCQHSGGVVAADYCCNRDLPSQIDCKWTDTLSLDLPRVCSEGGGLWVAAGAACLRVQGGVTSRTADTLGAGCMPLWPFPGTLHPRCLCRQSACQHCHSRRMPDHSLHPDRASDEQARLAAPSSRSPSCTGCDGAVLDYTV